MRIDKSSENYGINEALSEVLAENDKLIKKLKINKTKQYQKRQSRNGPKFSETQRGLNYINITNELNEYFAEIDYVKNKRKKKTCQ